MANEEIIIQIMFFTLGMVGLSEILNKVFGSNMDSAREMKEKSRNLQERMKTARLTGNPQEMAELQQESMVLTKLMMKKQMIPSCVRCAIFMGIFALIGGIYASYAEGLLPFPILFFGTGWFAIYFLFSISFSLIIYGIKRLYRRLTGKEDKRKKASKEILGMLSPASGNQESNLQLTRQIPNRTLPEYDADGEKEDDDGQPKSDSWKDRIKS
ncbi:MAG: EMC3/TMCO1 family protein [Promethearchaeota archaeon]